MLQLQCLQFRFRDPGAARWRGCRICDCLAALLSVPRDFHNNPFSGHYKKEQYGLGFRVLILIKGYDTRVSSPLRGSGWLRSHADQSRRIPSASLTRVMTILKSIRSPQLC